MILEDLDLTDLIMTPDGFQVAACKDIQPTAFHKYIETTHSLVTDCFQQNMAENYLDIDSTLKNVDGNHSFSSLISSQQNTINCLASCSSVSKNVDGKYPSTFNQQDMAGDHLPAGLSDADNFPLDNAMTW